MKTSEERDVTVGTIVGWMMVGLLLPFLIIERYQATEPLPIDASSERFSAERAATILKTIMGEGRPHPLWSREHAGIRERILAELGKLGYAPEVQRTFACSDYGACAPVSNLIARLNGGRSGRFVVVMAHYDSVAAGPGVSDDGVGVAAVLEMARALAIGPRHDSPILFLLTDGEERGLLGATAFVNEFLPPDAVKLVVNLEARGTSGPSLLFEVSGDLPAMLSLYASHIRHPVASSIFSAVYDRLPNDTDFTAFKKHGIPGYNLAFIGHPLRYHTARDNLESMSLASLQHHGDTALALVQAAAGADSFSSVHQDAVFFDLLGRWVIWWSVDVGYGMVGIALLCLLWGVVSARRRGLLSWTALSVGMAVGLLTVVSALALALWLRWGLQTTGAFDSSWVAEPRPAVIAFWGVGLLTGGVVAVLLGRKSSFWGLWIGNWTWAVMLALLCLMFIPGVSYLFLAPSIAAAVGSLPFLIRGWTGGRVKTGMVLPAAAVAACTWFPIAALLYDAMGLTLLPVMSVMVACVASVFTPLVAGASFRWRWIVPSLAGTITLVAAVVAIGLPPYSQKDPPATNVVLHYDDESRESRWLMASMRLPPRAPTNGAQLRMTGYPFPWSTERVSIVRAGEDPLPPPTFVVLDDVVGNGRRRVRARLSSPRRAPEVGLAVSGQVALQSVTVQRHAVPSLSARARTRRNGWHVFTVSGLQGEGAEIELEINGVRFEAVLFDRSFELPSDPESLRIVGSREGIPIHDGDGIVVTARLRL